MVTVNIVIDQSGHPAGYPGQSRDDLSLSVPVVLSNYEDSGVVAWNWRLLGKPTDSLAGLDTPTAPTCQFTPDKTGSYLIQLVLNGRVRQTVIAAVKTAYLGLRIPVTGETNEMGGWERSVEELMHQLEDGIEAGSGGSGASDRTLVFSDDTQFAEAGGSFVTKKTFRIVRDSNKAPVAWRVVVSLWGAASYDTAECRVLASGAGVDTLTLSSVTGTSETVVSGTLTINSSNEPANSLVTIQIQLRLASGSGAAYLQYTDVFAVYAVA
jgi:hypothetical protein